MNIRSSADIGYLTALGAPKPTTRLIAFVCSVIGALTLAGQTQAQALQDEMLVELIRDALANDGPARIESVPFRFADYPGMQITYSAGLGPSIFADKPAFLETFGDDDGRVYAFGRTGVTPYKAVSRLHWSKTYAKSTPGALTTFTVLPSWLELIDYGGQGYIDNLVAEFVIVVLLDGQQVFQHFAQIRGRGGTSANNTFELTREIPGDPSGYYYDIINDCGGECVDANNDPIPPSQWHAYGARYDIDGLTQAIDLSGYAAGQPFTVDYQLAAHVWGDGGETISEAFIGDPLEVETGVTLDTSELIAVEASAAAATCDPNFPQTTPTSQFDLAGSLATDLATDLQWLRCPEGTVWDDGATPSDPLDDLCLASGTTDFTWQEALQQVQSINSAGISGGGWRLPNVKELASIIELQCAFPAANQAVFPGIFGAGYWTGSPDIGTNGAAMWRVNFNSGEISAVAGSATLAVLLVRDPVQVVDQAIFSDSFESP